MGTFKEAIIREKEEQLPYLINMAITNAIGIKTYQKIQEYFPTPKSFYEAPIAKIENLKLLSHERLVKLEEARRTVNPLREFERLNRKQIKFTFIDAPDYPRRLKELKDAPPFIFYIGKLPEETRATISVVGARECSVYGMNVATRLGELISSYGVSLISGMARGIDSISQLSAVNAGGYSLAILGGGVEHIYPKESRILYDRLCEDGGVMSEIYPSTVPQKAFFAQRNRLISGYSDAVCVVEAKEKSGTLITVDCALDQGKEVFAVPGRISDITSFGTNELIRQGAGMITDIDGFLEDFSLRYCKATNTNNLGTGINILYKEETENNLIRNLNKNEIRVIRAMDENSFTAEQLSETLLLPAYEILSLCISLTQKALLKNVGAGRFVPMQKAIDLKNFMIKNATC